MEVGIGIHGEPGVTRERLKSADAIVDTAMDAIFKEMDAKPNERVAVLVNSFGATPMMELYILYRRVEQRLSARGIIVEANWIGHYCTSLDMVGASITIMHLDNELSTAAEPAMRCGVVQGLVGGVAFTSSVQHCRYPVLNRPEPWCRGIAG